VRSFGFHLRTGYGTEKRMQVRGNSKSKSKGKTKILTTHGTPGQAEDTEDTEETKKSGD